MLGGIRTEIFFAFCGFVVLKYCMACVIRIVDLENEVVLLKCSLSNERASNAMWKVNNSFLFIERDHVFYERETAGRFELLQNYSLLINGTRKTDTGTYVCKENGTVLQSICVTILAGTKMKLKDTQKDQHDSVPLHGNRLTFCKRLASSLDSSPDVRLMDLSVCNIQSLHDDSTNLLYCSGLYSASKRTKLLFHVDILVPVHISTNMTNISRRCVIVYMLLQVGVFGEPRKDAFANIDCPSPQYVVVGRTGRLDCSFPERFAAVYWKYEQGDEIYSLVGLEGAMKRGLGNENGKYDIHSNGSLIIKEVEVEDEGAYVVMLVTSEEDVKHFRIIVETTGYHRSPFGDFYCETPQYLKLGRAGQLHCKFPETFNAVIWKQERNGRQNTLVEKQNSLKNGQGFIYGLYDMHQNGSLIIHTVRATNDGVYDITLVTTEDNVEHAKVTLITTVLSKQIHPYINLCGEDDQCTRRYDPGTPIYCSYNHSRPAVNLNWYIRHPSNDTLLQASFNYEADSNETFSSISRLNIEDIAAGIFVFLVCVADGPPLTPHTIESWMILYTSQKIYTTLNSESISRISVPLYGNTVLSCGAMQPTVKAVIWLSVDMTDLTSTLLYAMYHTPQRRHYTYSSVDFDEHSTAIKLSRVTRENENIYTCLSTDGTHTEVMAAFQLAVFVTPSPPYIEVDACFNDMADCQLSSREGTLTCCISRVYRNVELATNVRDKSKISTSNEMQRRQSIGDGFVDHCVTFDYELHQDVCEYPVSVFCYARTEGGLEIVPRKEITFMNQEKCQNDIPSLHPVVMFPTLGVFATVIVVLVIIIVCLCLRKREHESTKSN